MDLPMPTRLLLLRLPILVVLLALSGLLWAGAAHAAQLVPGTTPLVFEEELAAEEESEEAEGEVEEGACEEAEEEFDEGELDATEVKEICEEEAAERRKKAAGPGAPAPEECILRSARGQATTQGNGDTLKLTIGYTT
jgi:cytoskeletal protein RodZ